MGDGWNGNVLSVGGDSAIGATNDDGASAFFLPILLPASCDHELQLMEVHTDEFGQLQIVMETQ